MTDKIIFERKVNYYETDKMGIVHHSNYIRYMEEARIDFLEKAGISYIGLEKMGIQIPVLSVTTEYKIPLKFGDIFKIECSVKKFNGVKFEIAYKFYKDDVLTSVAESSHCFVGEGFKPIRIKKYNQTVYDKFIEYMEDK